jgi:5-methylcytosine-specific restriction endonuclease McrA
MSPPPRPCIERGCNNLALTGRDRCHPHHRAWERARNRRADRQGYRDPAYRSAPKRGICWLCGLPGADTRDHVRPLSKGGTNDPSNIRPAHRACNSARGGRG